MQKLNSSDEDEQPSLSLANAEGSSSKKMNSASSYSSSSQVPPPDDRYDLILGLYDFDDLQPRSPTVEEKEREKELIGMFLCTSSPCFHFHFFFSKFFLIK